MGAKKQVKAESRIQKSGVRIIRRRTAATDFLFFWILDLTPEFCLSSNSSACDEPDDGDKKCCADDRPDDGEFSSADA
jgi:hypothetical protein